MKKLTLKEALTKCQQMWQILADNPGFDKGDALREMKVRKFPETWCYACEYGQQQADSAAIATNQYLYKCDFCPLWNKAFGCDSGAFGQWCDAKTEKARVHAAKVIVKMCDTRLKKL